MQFQVVWRRQRRARRPKELNNYPATPAAYYTGYYPGSKAAESYRVSCNFKLQQSPELNHYPATPAVVAVTAWLTHFEKTKGQTNHRIQSVQLNTYPPTPVGYYTGYYPGSALVFSNIVSFDQDLQKVPELNVTTPELAAVTSWLTHFEKTKNVTNRRIQSIQLNTYPATPAAYYNGHYPGSKAQAVTRVRFRRNLQKPLEINEFPSVEVTADVVAWLGHFERTRNNTNHKILSFELNEYPSTQAEYYTGYYPGSGRASSHKVGFKRALQYTELNKYPATPVSVATLPAVTYDFVKTKNNTKRHLLQVELSYYAPTPAGYLGGFHPGSSAVKANKISFSQVLQRIPELNYYPLVTGFPEVSSWLSHFERTANKTNRKLLQPELSYYAPTPAGYFDGFYPGSKFAEPYRTGFKRSLQITELNQYPVSPPPVVKLGSILTHFEKTRNHTKRKLLNLQLNTYPATPAAYYNGYYPGSKLAESFNRHQKRYLRKLPVQDYDQNVPIKLGTINTLRLSKDTKGIILKGNVIILSVAELTQVQIVQNDTPETGAFVYSVTMQPESYLAFGSVGNSTDADGLNPISSAGAVFAHDYVDSSWSGETKIVSPNRGSGYAFGERLDSGGDWIVTSEISQSIIHVIKKSTGLVVASATVAAVWEAGGYDVACSDDGSVIVIGITKASSAGGALYDGLAKIYTWDGTTLALQATISVNLSKSVYFGENVAISGDGNTVAVSMLANDQSTNNGVVYVFNKGLAWTDVAYTTGVRLSGDETTDLFDNFGVGEKPIAINTDGTLVVVGAGNASVVTSNYGAIYIFGKSGATYSKTIRIDGVGSEGLGDSVEINSNSDAVVAALPDYGSCGEGSYSGAFNLYKLVDSVWALDELVTPTVACGIGFGYNVAITDKHIAIVSKRYNFVNEGAVYMYRYTDNSYTTNIIRLSKDTKKIIL